MTVLRYPMGCAAGSLAHTLAWGIGCSGKVRPASSPYVGNSNNAWNVNFNNANVNNNHVRLVRASLWSVACKP
jgi:hypothetical protein